MLKQGHLTTHSRDTASFQSIELLERLHPRTVCDVWISKNRAVILPIDSSVLLCIAFPRVHVAPAFE